MISVLILLLLISNIKREFIIEFFDGKILICQLHNSMSKGAVPKTTGMGSEVNAQDGEKSNSTNTVEINQTNRGGDITDSSGGCSFSSGIPEEFGVEPTDLEDELENLGYFMNPHLGSLKSVELRNQFIEIRDKVKKGYQGVTVNFHYHR